MNAYNVGTIQQKKKKDGFIYKVEIIAHKLYKTFNDEKEAVRYAEEHCIGLLDTKEISTVSIKFSRADKRASFIILENKIDDNEKSHITIHEESAYDYIQTNSIWFKKHRTRTKMNERYYSFHDVARIGSTATRRGNFTRATIAFSLMFMSLLFAAWGYHLINGSDYVEKHKLDVDTTFFNYSILAIIVLSWAMIICIFLSFWLPYRAAKKKDWDYEDVNWRKYYKIKRTFSWLALFFVAAALGVTITYSYSYFTSDLFEYKHKYSEAKAFDVISWVYAGLGIIVAIIHIVEHTKMYIRERKILPKYFNENEIKEYKRWLRNKDVNVAYKTDQNFFHYPVEANSKIILTKIMAFEEIERSTSYDQLEEFSKKSAIHYDIARKHYLASLKTKENSGEK